MERHDSGDSDADYHQMNAEMQEQPHALPESQSPVKGRSAQRAAFSAASTALAAPLLESSPNPSLNRAGSLQFDPNAKYRPQVLENCVHQKAAQVRCRDWMWFLVFLGGLYAALLGMMYALLAAVEKDSYTTGVGCLAGFIALGTGIVAVIIHGEVKHCQSQRHRCHPKSPHVH